MISVMPDHCMLVLALHPRQFLAAIVMITDIMAVISPAPLNNRSPPNLVYGYRLPWLLGRFWFDDIRINIGLHFAWLGEGYYRLGWHRIHIDRWPPFFGPNFTARFGDFQIAIRALVSDYI